MDQDGFDRLLAWLGNGDREQGALEYEKIRLRLIRVLVRRSCYEAEVLADESFNRVSEKPPEFFEAYEGDPALYLLGVANKVWREWIRRKELEKRLLTMIIPEHESPAVLELWDECLTACLDQLDSKDRELIFRYFAEKGSAKIKTHKEMADELVISVNALRTRAHRIKKVLKDCVLRCVRQNEE